MFTGVWAICRDQVKAPFATRHMAATTGNARIGRYIVEGWRGRSLVTCETVDGGNHDFNEFRAVERVARTKSISGIEDTIVNKLFNVSVVPRIGRYIVERSSDCYAGIGRE